MQINITDFFSSAQPANYSASVMELGQDAGRITWENSKGAAEDWAAWLDTEDKRNDLTLDEIELRRDGQRIKDWQLGRVRFYQVNSRFFRHHLGRIEHLLSTYGD